MQVRKKRKVQVMNIVDYALVPLVYVPVLITQCQKINS